jgi:hypothetical protein
MTRAELVQNWDASVPENYLKLLVSDVPTALHPLIPYAQVFGITDDGYRSELLERVPWALAEHVESVVLESHCEALMAWLTGAASHGRPNEAYSAFTALLMAADELSIMRRKNRLPRD